MVHYYYIEMKSGQTYRVRDDEDVDERFNAIACLLAEGAEVGFPDRGVQAWDILGDGPWERGESVVNMVHDYQPEAEN